MLTICTFFIFHILRRDAVCTKAVTKGVFSRYAAQTSFDISLGELAFPYVQLAHCVQPV